MVTSYVAQTLGDATGFSVADAPSEWTAIIVEYLLEPATADRDSRKIYKNVAANYSHAQWHEDMLRLEAVTCA